eukprot:GHVL01021075.1.p1 GENE.GHVL01021075.1~~GHVL01021075.1.p1  ORF type:complete len:111 (+),score=22.39 GHVL01021075.1:24-335(+)
METQYYEILIEELTKHRILRLKGLIENTVGHKVTPADLPPHFSLGDKEFPYQDEQIWLGIQKEMWHWVSEDELDNAIKADEIIQGRNAAFTYLYESAHKGFMN